MTDLLQQAQLLSDLSGKSEVADKLGKAQQAVQLAQSVAGTAGEVAGHLSQGDVLGAGAALLGLGGGLGSPSGLQFTFEVTGLPPMTFSVVSFDYRAHYSELYSLSLHLTSSLPTIPVDSVLERSGCLTIWQDGKSLQTLSGMVSSFAQGDSGFLQTAYFLEVSPDLWRTTLRHNARIFQQKNLTTILSTLLTEHGITQYAFAFTQSHPTREFCVQWQESDFDFIQRLSAEEGVFYYFEQRDGQHTLVFSDNAETLSEVQAFPYNLNRHAQLQEKSVYQFLQRHRVKQSGAVLKDYTFKKPDWPAQFQRQSSEADRKPNPLYEHFDYPGRFKDSEQGKAFTQYRLESLQQDVAQGEGQSNIPQLQVGRLLELSQHPNPAYNTPWQLIEVICRGEQPQSSEGQAGEKGTYFTNVFKVIPRHQTWRPMQRTKPKVDGPQIARVVGPKGEEIFTDNFGRIRLQFLWDRESQGDDHSSCWIRVTQPWAGQGWGVLAIPRVGQEVLVDFLDGDPDQPIVTGRTYNAQQLPPGGLPQSKTQMAFRSKTYKGEGYNELLFEDAPGREQLNFHAQRDMNVVVLNDKSAHIHHRHTEVIEKNKTLTVHAQRNKTVHKSEYISILGNMGIDVKEQESKKVKKDILISSQNGSISFSVGESLISLDNEGTLLIQSAQVKIDGERVFFNSHSVSPFSTNSAQSSSALMATSSEDSNSSNSSSSEMEDAVLAAYLSNEVYTDRGKGLSEEFKQKYPDVEEVSDVELIQLGIEPRMLEDKKIGFQANIYKKGDKYFLAYRGTEVLSLKDIKTDLDGSVGKMNLQFETAKELSETLYKNIPVGSKMVITGHSLGGELTKLNTDTGHTISATKEIERETRKYYEK
ncbi:type VI secretion system tip protein TssI/VgrG [Ursidibacter sp. B-7004-1]